MVVSTQVVGSRVDGLTMVQSVQSDAVGFYFFSLFFLCYNARKAGEKQMTKKKGGELGSTPD